MGTNTTSYGIHHYYPYSIDLCDSIQIQPVTLTRSILDGSPLSEPLVPHVQPAYYAAIIAAEAIGKTGSARAVELSIDDPCIAGYAFYEGGTLVRAILINSQAYLANNASGSRGTIHVNIQLDNSTGIAPFIMSIKRLAIGCELFVVHVHEKFDSSPVCPAMRTIHLASNGVGRATKHLTL